ncbi:MAG: hypothetical protein M1274_07805 [Actinobacteria bacterium]|nr:hypothetical protein [Actinomycetota bacterium]
MKRILKLFGVFALLGSLVAGAYYFLVMRSRKPQVELYFDDGSMLAMQGNAAEAAPFISVAREILAANPIGG